MGKPIVNMTDWNLYIYEGKYNPSEGYVCERRYNLSGVADAHPRLGRNTYIMHSSSLERFSFEKDVMTYETRNTIYVCPLKYMKVYPYRNVLPEYKEKLAHLDEQSDCILDQIIAATARLALQADKITGEEEFWRLQLQRAVNWEALGLDADNMDDEMAQKIIRLSNEGQKEIVEAKEREERRLLEIVQQYEDSVYLEVSKVDTGDTLAYHLGTDMGTVVPQVHTGMFQDSVLYMKYATEDDPCSLDFRYFPKGMFGDTMETYSWSENIRQAVIKNVGERPLEFNHSRIEPGETKVFTPDTHQQGLISPDCHNGKSILEHLFDTDEE